MATSPILNTSVRLMHFGGVMAIPGIVADVDDKWLTHPRVVIMESNGEVNLSPPPPASEEPGAEQQQRPQRPPQGAQQPASPPQGAQQPAPPPEPTTRPSEGAQMPAPGAPRPGQPPPPPTTSRPLPAAATRT